MVDFALPEEVEKIRDMTREFAQKEIRPASIELDRIVDPVEAYSSDTMRRVLSRAYEVGFHKMGLPKEVGGLGAPPMTNIVVEEELANLKKRVQAPLERQGGFGPRWVTQVLQNITRPYYILYVKHETRLQAALTLVEFLRDHLVPKLYAKDPHELRLVHETKNMVLNAEMKLRASLFRTESRGRHYREDYPRRDDPDWLAWIKLWEENGTMTLSKEPIPQKWWPDLSTPYEERYPARFPGE